jgi:hypothetical protein
MVGDQVDAFASDALLARSLDPARGGRGGWSERAGVTLSNAVSNGAETSTGASSAASGAQGAPLEADLFRIAKVRREAARADAAEIEVANLRADTFRRSDLERAGAEAAAFVQQQLALLPTRFASLVGPKYGIDQRALANDIEDELGIAQEEIVAAIRALARNAVRTVQ